MDTYPLEFVVHPIPVMAIIGLSPESPSLNAIQHPGDPSFKLSSRGRSASTSVSSELSPQPTTGRPRRSSLVIGQPASQTRTVNKTLLSLLTGKSQPTVWEAAKFTPVTGGAAAGSSGTVTGLPVFHVVTVDKTFTLPNRKPPVTQPPAATVGPTAHSPLSPLTPSSPVHPDGLITPAWVRKHRELLPAVTVAFYDLWDWSMDDSRGGAAAQAVRPKREAGPLGAAQQIDPVEREKDQAMAAEVNERRKYFQDRGVKFAAVVILKQQHIDDVAIEERLKFIRKESGLDSKNSFFVLPPGGQSELQDFVNNLYRSLYDYAITYYSVQVKRVRRKRSRLPALTSSSRPPMAPGHMHQAQVVAQPLNVQGWMIRYEIKAGVFSEFKQDIEGAVRSYESAYNLLVDMFAPMSAITPGYPGFAARSKRWAEARMLADCLNLKICRLYMFLDSNAAVLAQLNKHLHAFQSFSTAWGMGEGSFEYWAWLSKQYRIFADNLDVATRAGFKLPVPTPQMSTTPGMPAGPGAPGGGAGLGYVGLTGGVNPGTVLQHAGFYYHVAAMCSAERRRRYLEMEKTEKAVLRAAAEAQAVLQTPTPDDSPSKELGTPTSQPTTPSGNAALLVKERQVDHSSLTIELLTKGYEQFKRHKNGRMTLYLAAEIAGTYYEAGKYEMALKFFERIGKTYRKENWHTVLTSILRWSLRCAKELGAWDHVVEYLIELMAGQLTMMEQKRIDIQNELFDVLYKNETANTIVHRPIILGMDQLNSFLTCSAQFKSRAATVGTAVSFQVTLSTHPDSPPLPFRFTSMRIIFSDARFNQWYVDADDTTDKHVAKGAVEWIDCTDAEPTEQDSGSVWSKRIDLRFMRDVTKVVEGVVQPVESGELKILTISLSLESPNWNVQLNFGVADRIVEQQITGKRRWLEAGKVGEDGTQQLNQFTMLDGRGDVPVLRVNNRPPQIEIKITHSSPALLDECCPLSVSIINSEADVINAQVSVEIKTADGQESIDFVTLEPAASDQNIGSTTLTDIEIGNVGAGETRLKTVYLHGTGVAATRLVTVTVRYSLSSQSGNLVERQEILRVPFVAPFDTSFEVYPQVEPPRLESDEQGLDFLPPLLERDERSLLVAAVKNNGPCDITVEAVDLLVEESNNLLARVTQEYSATGLRAEENDNVWKPGYIFSGNYLLKLSTTDVTAPKSPVRVGTLVITWRRHSDLAENLPFSKTIVNVPSLEFIKSELTLIADVPSEAYVGEPFTLTYTINNPTLLLAELAATIELTDAFVFSGYKQMAFRVLPLSSTRFYYNCYPILTGRVKLPRLKVVVKKEGTIVGTLERELQVETVGGRAVPQGSAAPEKAAAGSEDDISGQLLVFVKPRKEY